MLFLSGWFIISCRLLSLRLSSIQTSPTDNDTSVTKLLPHRSDGLSKPARLSPDNKRFDAIIAIGVVIKGTSTHFENVCNAVSHGLMDAQLESGTPVIFGLLSVLDREQGLERAGLGEHGKHNHGETWGQNAVDLGIKRREWVQGKLLVPGGYEMNGFLETGPVRCRL